MSTTEQQVEIQELLAKLPPAQLGNVLAFLREMYQTSQVEGSQSNFDWARVGRIMRDNDDVLHRLAQ